MDFLCFLYTCVILTLHQYFWKLHDSVFLCRLHLLILHLPSLQHKHLLHLKHLQQHCLCKSFMVICLFLWVIIFSCFVHILIIKILFCGVAVYLQVHQLQLLQLLQLLWLPYRKSPFFTHFENGSVVLFFFKGLNVLVYAF